jgi:hypothetical protein
MNPRFLLTATFLFSLATLGPAQQGDAPAPDLAQILQFLKTLKEQQAEQLKSGKRKVLQDAQSAAASPAAAAAAWVESVRLTQFEGAEKEGAQFRDWKEKEGSAFSEEEVQRAAQLYFRWLTLTMQRSLGTSSRDLLPQVIQYTKDVAAEKNAMKTFNERLQKEKDLAQSRLHGMRRDKAQDAERTKRVHDQLLSRSLPEGAPVKAMRAEEFVKMEKGSWAMNPGDIDGIFTAIILPELRAAKDSRVLDYWDMKIKKDSEDLKDAPSFEQEKFTKERLPSLQWSRAQEYVAIGQPNRAVGEMFKVLRANPQHPSMNHWIGEIEKLLSPKSPTEPPK